MAEPTLPGNLPVWDTDQNDTPPYAFTEPDTNHQNNGYQVDEIPASGVWNWIWNTVYLWIQYFSESLAYWLGANANEVLTITSEIVVPTQANSTFQTAGGTVANATATNFKAGRFWSAMGNGSNATTLVAGSGGSGALNLVGGVNVSLKSTNDCVMFQLNGTTGNWDEIWRSASLGAGPAQAMVVLTTPGTGSVTVPAGKTGVYYRMVGGGGGGGICDLVTSGSGIAGEGGGGGGAYQEGVITGLVPGNSLSYNVGAAGSGGTNPPGEGSGNTAGGNSWLVSSSSYVASGGAAGGVNSEYTSPGAGGAGGVATFSSSQWGCSGGAGSTGSANSGSTGGGGGAGGQSGGPQIAILASYQAAGGSGASSGDLGGTGTAGISYGGGGGGAGGNGESYAGSSQALGGNGGSGLIILQWR